MQPPETETVQPPVEPTPPPKRRSPTEHILRLHGHTVRLKEATLQYVGVLTVLLILIGIFSYLQPQFHTWTNFLNILETNATLLILSVGLTFVLLVGGFDLSIGGVLALSGVGVAKLLEQGVGTYGSVVIVEARRAEAMVASTPSASRSSTREKRSVPNAPWATTIGTTTVRPPTPATGPAPVIRPMTRTVTGSAAPWRTSWLPSP